MTFLVTVALVHGTVLQYVSMITRGSFAAGCSNRWVERRPWGLGTWVFTLIMVSNLIGLIPGCYTLGSVPLLALFGSTWVWFNVTYELFGQHGWSLIGHWTPLALPSALILFLAQLELLSYVFRLVSLGARLCANLTAGHVILKLIMGSLLAVGFYDVWLGIFLAAFTHLPLLLFEVFVAVIQAYIFTFLWGNYRAECLV